MTRAFAASDFQSGFSTALLDPSAPVPAFVRAHATPRTEAGFAVYRNNVVAGLIKAVSRRFPVVRRLAGEDSFDAVAHRYVVARPPRSPMLIEYGGDFPGFVRGLGSEAMFEYLADIAELEWLRGRAYHAADAVPVTREAFAMLADRLGQTSVKLHPSAFMLRSRFPIVTIWESNLEGSAGNATIDRWGPEYALVARPLLDVQVWRLSTGGYAFIDALGRCLPLADAADAALSADPGFDLAGAFTLLLESNIVVGFAEPMPL